MDSGFHLRELLVSTFLLETSAPNSEKQSHGAAGCNSDEPGDSKGDFLGVGVLVHTWPGLEAGSRSLPLLLEIKNWREIQTLPYPTQVGTRGEKGRIVDMENAT